MGFIKKRMRGLLNNTPSPVEKKRQAHGLRIHSMVPSCLNFDVMPAGDSPKSVEPEVTPGFAVTRIASLDEPEWGIVDVGPREGEGMADVGSEGATSGVPETKAAKEAVITRRESVSGYVTRVTGTWYAMAAVDDTIQEPKAPIILYSTSMAAIRKTFEESNKLRNMLQNFGVEFDERDVFLNPEYRPELKDRLQGLAAPVPRMFIGNRYLGGHREVDELNEDGKLRKLLEQGGYLARKRAATLTCAQCANRRFVLCTECQGSRKIRTDGTISRCKNCNEAGLIKCPNSECAFQPSEGVPATSLIQHMKTPRDSLSHMRLMSHVPVKKPSSRWTVKMPTFRRQSTM